MVTTVWGGPEVTRLNRYVIARDGGLCQMRDEGCTGQATTVQHLVPRCDTDPRTWFDPDGCVAACAHCNFTDGAKLGNRRLREKRARAAQVMGPSREW